MIDELVRYAKKILLRTILFPLRLIPVKSNRVMLINDLSYNFSDNPKYVAQYLRDYYPKEFELFFAVNEPEKYALLQECGIKPIRFNSRKYFFCCMTSKVILTNSGGVSYIPLRKTQYLINTWHGGGAYKKAGIHMYNNSYLFRKDLKLSSKMTNAFLSTNHRFTECVSEAMLVPKNVFWEIGMPRNDMLINGNDSLRKQVRDRLGLKDEDRLVLFAPTYRKVEDNYFRDSVAISYGIDNKRVCQALKKRFGGNWCFAIRLHPCVVNRDEFIPEGVLDLTDYVDMQELLLATDVMINDFSSSMWDFMLTGKPCFTYAVDLQHYVETTEVYTPVSEWPFPKATNNDELEKEIIGFNEEKYAKDCKRHYDDLGGCETGKATKLTCERIYEICYGKIYDTP